MTFSQFLNILRARKLIVLLCLTTVVGVTTALSLIWPKSYSATASVLVDVKGADPLTGVYAPGAMLPGYMATQVDVLTSKTVAAKVVDKLRLLESPGIKQQWQDDTQGKGDIRFWLADLLLKKLDVKPSRESSVIEINFASESPAFASLIANAFAEAYIETNLDLRIEPAKQSNDFFEKQLKGLRANLDEKQKVLSKYQQDKGIVAVDERLDVENARLAELSSLVVGAQGMKVDSASRERQIVEAGGRGDSVADIANNPLIQNLKAELARSEAKLSELGSRLGRNHPQFREAQAEADGIRQKLDAEIKVASSGITNTAQMQQRKESELRSALATQKSRVLELKKQRDEMSLLTREVENAQRAYDAALQRASQTRLESQANQTNVVLLTRATEPVNASKPKVLLNIILSVFVAACWAWALPFCAK
jgi:succinoglycan biosynthesis transport protein ExoP